MTSTQQPGTVAYIIILVGAERLSALDLLDAEDVDRLTEDDNPYFFDPRVGAEFESPFDDVDEDEYRCGICGLPGGH